MELTKETSRNEKYESNFNNMNSISKTACLASPKLLNNNKAPENLINNEYVKVNSKFPNKKNKIVKKVKFKTQNFREIIKVESYKKYNVNEEIEEYSKDFSKCNCIIL